GLCTDLRSGWVPVAVANAVEQVMLRFEMRAPEPLTEAVVDALVPAVRCSRKACVQNAHAGGQAGGSRLEHEAVVVAHQREGQHPPVVGPCKDVQRAKEETSELVVEDRLPVVASTDDVIVGTGFLMARPPSHAGHRRRSKSTVTSISQSCRRVGAVPLRSAGTRTWLWWRGCRRTRRTGTRPLGHGGAG